MRQVVATKFRWRCLFFPRDISYQHVLDSEAREVVFRVTDQHVRTDYVHLLAIRMIAMLLSQLVEATRTSCERDSQKLSRRSRSPSRNLSRLPPLNFSGQLTTSPLSFAGVSDE
jgi:hypothetical protein